jgi:hypothetical protein
MAHDVFISHSAKDKVTADAVCAMLESEGVRCWIAPRDVLPSMEWSEAIIDAIEECRIMVLVFTANANESPQIRREVERAVSHGVAVLPVRIEDVLPGKGLEYFIGNVHWLDALKPPLDTHLRNLAGTIKIVLARAERPTVAQTPQPAKPGPAPSVAPPLLAESRPAAGAAEIPFIPQPAVIGKSLEQPEGSGAPIFGAWQSGGGTVAAAPQRKVPVWAWATGGGVVLALLLAAVFAAGHFTSHSAAAVPPPAAPELVQGSIGPGGPGGTTPTAPAGSALPAPAATPGAPETAKPGGMAPAAPAAAPSSTPGAASSKAPSLEDAMGALQDEMGSVGTLSFTIFGRNENDGSNLRQSRIVAYTNVVADPAQCRVTYRRRVWLDGAAQPALDQNQWVSLRGVTSVVVEPLSQYLTEANAASGQANIIVNSATPPVAALVAHLPDGSSGEVTFANRASAERAAATVTQAVRLCGGHLAN